MFKQMLDPAGTPGRLQRLARADRAAPFDLGEFERLRLPVEDEHELEPSAMSRVVR